MTDFLSPGLAAVPGAAAPGAPALGLWIVPLMPSLPASAGLASSGFLATSTFFGAAIIARIAAASASAALRRLARSAGALLLLGLDACPALTTRSAGLAGSAGLPARRRRLRRLAAAAAAAWPLRVGRWQLRRQRRRLRRRPAAAAFAPARGFGGLALGALLLFAQAALLGQLFFLAAQRSACACGLFLAALQFGFVDLGAAGSSATARRRFVALDEGALLAHLDLDGAGLAARSRPA